MTDHIEAALRQALHERGEEINPTPALPGILHRASRTQAPRRRWLPVALAALGTAGVLVAALVMWPGSTSGPATPPVGSRPTSGPAGVAEPGLPPVVPGTKVPMALHVVSDYAGDTLVSGEFIITSSGDPGVDAVQALLTTAPGDPFTNWWPLLNSDPADADTSVRSVALADDLLTVDFDGPLTLDCADAVSCVAPDADMAMQQLVQTLHSALRTEVPVLVTIDGQPAQQAFDSALNGPIAADVSVAPGIRVESPEQGATVDGTVFVTGESTSFEGTVQWEALLDGDVAERGYTTGGSMGEFAPFELSIDLAPGDYTIVLWEENVAGGREGLSRRLSPAYLDITVE